jgi:hypothetical protein
MSDRSERFEEKADTSSTGDDNFADVRRERAEAMSKGFNSMQIGGENDPLTQFFKKTAEDLQEQWNKMFGDKK